MPTSGFVSAGRPGTPTLSNNEITNPNFAQGDLGWQYVSAASGTTEWSDTGGRFGLASTKIIIVSHERAIRPDANELVPVEVGQRRRYRFWRRITAASVGVDVDIALRVHYFSSNDVADFISSTLIGFLDTDTGTDGYKLVTGHHTVPDDPAIVYMRLEAAAKYTDGGYTVRFDAFQQKRVLGATGPLLTDTTTINSGDTGAGLTWEILRSITVGTPGDPVGLSFSFEGRVGDAGSLSTGNASIQVRVQRFDADGTSNETNVMAATLIGDTIDPGTDFGPWGTHIGNCTDDSGAAGTFVYRAQFSTNRTNAKASVRQRIIAWRLESAG